MSGDGATLRVRSADGREISSVDDWLLKAPPKRGIEHWVDGRSAKELAKALFASGRAGLPPEVRALLDSHAMTSGMRFSEAIPEVVVPLDAFRGEARNTDLILIGEGVAGRVVVSVEAKADESFDKLIGPYVDARIGTRSRLPERVDHLSKAVFGRSALRDPQLRALRYQLLVGIAGAAIAARTHGARIAVFAVFEFLSRALTPGKVETNAADLDRFVRALPGLDGTAVRDGILIGPVRLSGGGFVPADSIVLIGKVVRRLD